ncbi:hypothetical protein J5N97_009526 [Dioscorea zingiberensis]|uniref:Pectinesterase n=1 Tax=Dioscorea zingiberensis TaxID=325984 RepID=A0A9D5HM11_9LILI|nr:hypothetical protein J5N97_009526 [Dioscorea zingiberensis]
MATTKAITLRSYLLLLYVMVSVRVSTCSSSEAMSSCSQTPYPLVCTSIMKRSASTVIPQYYLEDNDDQDDTTTSTNPFHFRSSAIQATMQRAVHTHKLASSMNSLGSTAWADCLELCDQTISHLNRSILLGSISTEDAQTWLSAAMANEQTCLDGFNEVPLDHSTAAASSNINPFPVTTNMSEMISNLLAINKASKTNSGSRGGNRRLLAVKEFPRWVSAADRKLLQSSSSAVKANIVVAQDGSGDYKTISAAVAASNKLRSTGSSNSIRFVIHVKAGVYKENVQISKSMKNLMIIGDGIDKTIVTGSKNVIDGSTTFRSATFAVTGEGFIARGMTFENTAGPEKHQAVALRSGSDLSVFYECSFKGYQDTLYAHSLRQLYRNCDIYGTVDFIFGDAAAVFQNCNIYVRKPLSQQKNTVTAQGRKDPNENTGFSFHDSAVAAASDLQPVQGSFRTYLGRPWKEYSRTVFMKTSLGGLIDPAGWLEWDGDFALSTLYYGEYMNSGAGAGTSGRVKWPGFHVITDASEAAKFTVKNFLSGDNWIPSTGIPYTSGL